MKNCKKVLSVILALVMMLSVVTATSVVASADSNFPAYDENQPNLVIGNAEYTGTGNVVVPVIINNNPGIWGANFQISYATGLNYVEPTSELNANCSVLTGFCKATNDANNRVVTIYVESATLEDAVSDGVVLNLTFAPATYVVGTTYPISFTFVDRKSIINANGQDLELTYKNGSVTCVDPAPATPAMKSVAYSAANKVKVTWAAAAGAAKYEVQRRLGTGAWKVVKTVTTTSYIDTVKTAGSYSYRVVALSATGVESAASAAKTIKTMSFSVKAKIKKVAAGKKQVTVTIGTKVKNAKGYEFVVGTNSKATKGVKKATSTKATATIKKLKAKTVYYAKVRAYTTNASGKKIYGAWSLVKKASAKTK